MASEGAFSNTPTLLRLTPDVMELTGDMYIWNGGIIFMFTFLFLPLNFFK